MTILMTLCGPHWYFPGDQLPGPATDHLMVRVPDGSRIAKVSGHYSGGSLLYMPGIQPRGANWVARTALDGAGCVDSHRIGIDVCAEWDRITADADGADGDAMQRLLERVEDSQAMRRELDAHIASQGRLYAEYVDAMMPTEN